MFWFIPILIGLAFTAIGYLLMPRPKIAKPEAAKEADNPTAEAGKTIPKVFGTLLIKSPNVLWFGDKSISERTTGS